MICVAVLGQGVLWVGSSGSEDSFPCRVGHHDCSKAGNAMGKQKAADDSPGQADGESGPYQHRGWKGSFMGSGSQKGLSSLPSHCPLEFLCLHIPLRSELRGPVADGGPMEPLGQGQRDSSHPEWRRMVKAQGLV